MVKISTIFSSSGWGGAAFQIIHSLLSLFALYLSFKINDGFNFGSFIISLIFPYIYIAYAFAIHGIDIIWKDAIHKRRS